MRKRKTTINNVSHLRLLATRWASFVLVGVRPCNVHNTKASTSAFVSSFSAREVALHFPKRRSLAFEQHSRRRSRLWTEPPPVVSERSGDVLGGDLTRNARERLQQDFNFPLDSWQVEAGGEILAGRNVIVCAPTGAGKTVVGEMAVRIAFDNGENAIYTTPLKALSNQKFAEFRKVFGPEKVGLATGDMSINRGARITVMTTEVYRNMAWRASGNSDPESDEESFDDLASNSVVVLDEFHYMGQAGRGGVWEECVITSPSHTQIVGLSATLPNGDQLAHWMESVTGRQTTLIEAVGGRPVPLRYLFATKDGLNHLFRDPDAGPGAPKGLLGLRGDGTPPPKAKKKKDKKKKGFSGAEDEVEKEGGFPKGLQLNPILVNAMEKRMRYIDRKIERRALRDEFNSRSASSSDYSSPRRSAREERRERERLLRAEMRRAVPSLSFLVKRLEQKNLLPAIFFIFSRAGCDEAAETVCHFMRMQGQSPSVGDSEDDESRGYERRRGKRKTRSRGRRDRSGKSDEDWYSEKDNKRSSMAKDSSGRSFRLSSNYVTDETMASILDPVSNQGRGDSNADNFSPSGKLQQCAEYGLLQASDVEEVASRVSAFNRDNAEIAFDDAVSERFLFGVGSHHAGMLAAHKAFVETLFKAQLMKVVFATETLAAGINMPARTTVVCALAKRGDNSAMNLLETSNLLQMAGRAGRRGMDTDGTCAIVATPFEGPNEAQSILTSEIKPIVSQFTPSYSLAVNLVARGQGKLDVAQGLVQKSFAMWERQQKEESIESAKETYGDEMSEVLKALAHGHFLDTLKDSLEALLEKGQFGPSKRFKAKFAAVIEMLANRKTLKKESKSYMGLAQILDLERNTLKYLEREAEAMDTTSDKNDVLEGLFSEDAEHIQSEMEIQRRRLQKSERDVNVHIFTSMAEIANSVLSGSGPEATVLRAALSEARPTDPNSPITADELTTYAKSATVMKRKKRKMKTKMEGSGTQSLFDSLNDIDTSADKDDTWEDMLALVNVLEAYGCISPVDESIFDPEEQTYALTVAGENIGLLGFENALWCLTALGGAWDVLGESRELDEFRSAMNSFDSDESDEDDSYLPTSLSAPIEDESGIPKPQREVESLISLLRSLSPSELAGYVSCLVSEGSRGGSSSVVESFMKLTPTQQPVIQSSLLALERLMEVQKKFSVDENSSRCRLELATCDVVTAWAAGCSWSEALEMCGAAPGDLARTLHRALDALRQFGNLPINPVRATGATVQDKSSGIHPDIRRLCREAARAMDRYPVKDPLPFDENEDEIEVVYTEDLGDDTESTEEKVQ